MIFYFVVIILEFFNIGIEIISDVNSMGCIITINYNIILVLDLGKWKYFLI